MPGNIEVQVALLCAGTRSRVPRCGCIRTLCPQSQSDRHHRWINMIVASPEARAVQPQSVATPRHETANYLLALFGCMLPSARGRTCKMLRAKPSRFSPTLSPTQLFPKSGPGLSLCCHAQHDRLSNPTVCGPLLPLLPSRNECHRKRLGLAEGVAVIARQANRRSRLRD